MHVAKMGNHLDKNSSSNYEMISIFFLKHPVHLKLYIFFNLKHPVCVYVIYIYIYIYN